MVEEVRGVGWHFLGGLSKHLSEVREILDRGEVPETPTSFVHVTRAGTIYATKARAALWKTEREVELVRHRRERRVRAYLFVCGLAYRLEMALRWLLLEGGIKEHDVAEYQERLLEELGRVERTEVRLGGQGRTWFLNVTANGKDGLKRLGQEDLLKEGPVPVPLTA